MAKLLRTYHYNVIRKGGRPSVESLDGTVSLDEKDASGSDILRYLLAVQDIRFGTVLYDGIIECAECLLGTGPAFAQQILTYTVLRQQLLYAGGGDPAEYDAFQRHVTNYVTARYNGCASESDGFNVDNIIHINKKSIVNRQISNDLYIIYITNQS